MWKPGRPFREPWNVAARKGDAQSDKMKYAKYQSQIE